MQKIEFFLGRDAVLSEGVKLGEKVVIEGQRMLMDGSLVEEKKARMEKVVYEMT